MTRTKNQPKRQTVDRFRVFNAFIDFTLRELSRTESAVWLVLYRDTKPDGIAKTSQADIAKRCGMSDRTVRRVIRRLEQLGLLLVVHRGGLQQGATAYRVFPMSRERLDKL
ncbi:helix-turn-helix domain-containing protein [Crateriforma spongiae]|uniref:helix-turn-helix domain-containing protein n=1 Tax=Crateriforma spongiae TaxID=2724528 RepID=UPI00144620B6|nr:helix-turn-helix domain-containing protein [Crateriforma spongiae]